jgi:adenylate cyclase
LAVESTRQGVGLREPARSLERGVASGARSLLAGRIARRLAIVLPAINLVSAAATYIFIEFVVPIPGGAEPAAARSVALVGSLAVTAVAWLVCDLWGKRAFAPVRLWLERGGEPDEAERTRAIRLPLHQAGQVFVVWAVAGTCFGAFDVTVGGSLIAGALITGMVVIGGLVASALCYLATEWIMRPAIACALEVDPPTRPLMPGIAMRIYLAWEFGTAVAIWGAIVVSIAYLSGAHMSPRRMAATVIFLGGVALTVGLVTLLAALKSVALPVRRIRRAMAQVEGGDNDVSVRVDDGSELGLLQAGFNRMVAGLRERDQVRDLFGRHVGEEVARSALGRGHELGGELRQVSVLFVDVVGSTSYAAGRDPHEVVETLNRFFSIVVDVVTLHGGWVNKFEGDAALCAFGAPTEHPDAASAALVAARELHRRLHLELDGLDAALGVSAGTVVAGNIGAAQRYEYTVVGDPVNEAARLTELAKSRPSRLLASEGILRQASELEATHWTLGEQVALRGRPQATRIAAPA